MPPLQTNKEKSSMTTYLVHGFSRTDNKAGVSMLVDADFNAGEDPGDIAEAIAGDGYCFHASQNLFVAIPDDVKNILFTSDEQLYERVPQLRPKTRRKRGASK
jgi:hypothetical protein